MMLELSWPACGQENTQQGSRKPLGVYTYVCKHPEKVARWNNGPQFLLVPLNGTHVGGSCRALACQRIWGPTVG